MEEDFEDKEVSSTAQVARKKAEAATTNDEETSQSSPPLWEAGKADEQKDENELLDNMRTKIETKGNMLSRTWTELYSLMTHYQAELISKEGKTTLAQAMLNNREQQLIFRNQSTPIDQEKIALHEELLNKNALLKKTDEELSGTKRLLARLQADLRSSDKLLEETRAESMRIEQKFLKTVTELGRKQTELVVKDELLVRIQQKMAEESSKLNGEIGQLKLALALEKGSRDKNANKLIFTTSSKMDRPKYQNPDPNHNTKLDNSSPLPEIKSTSTSITSRLHLPATKVKIKQEIDYDDISQSDDYMPTGSHFSWGDSGLSRMSHAQEMLTLRHFMSTPETVPSSSGEMRPGVSDLGMYGSMYSTHHSKPSAATEASTAMDLSLSQSSSSISALSQMRDCVEQLVKTSPSLSKTKPGSTKAVTQERNRQLETKKVLKKPKPDPDATTTVPHGQFTPLHVPQIPRMRHTPETTNVPATEKPYQCNLCPSVCSSKHSLLRHIRVVHGGEKPYKCELCDMRFGFLWNLKTHMRTHTGEKPFGCAQCGARYRQIGDLYRHQRLRNHGGDRPYKCDICNKTFSQKWSLQQHIKSH